MSFKKPTCRTCGGYGVTAKNPTYCEDCGTYANGVKTQSIVHEDRTLVKVNIIPEEYEEVIFDLGMFKNINSEIAMDTLFQYYCNGIEKITSRLLNGELPKASCLFYAPQGFGKQILAYTWLKLARDKGLSVLPYLDTNQIDLILNAVEDKKALNDITQYWGDITPNMIYHVDFLVVKIPVGVNNRDAYKTILHLLDTRSRLGKTTIFFSRLPISVIKYADRFNELDKAIQKPKQPYFKKNLIVYPYKTTNY